MKYKSSKACYCHSQGLNDEMIRENIFHMLQIGPCVLYFTAVVSIVVCDWLLKNARYASSI